MKAVLVKNKFGLFSLLLLLIPALFFDWHESAHYTSGHYRELGRSATNTTLWVVLGLAVIIVVLAIRKTAAPRERLNLTLWILGTCAGLFFCMQPVVKACMLGVNQLSEDTMEFKTVAAYPLTKSKTIYTYPPFTPFTGFIEIRGLDSVNINTGDTVRFLMHKGALGYPHHASLLSVIKP